MIPKHPRTIAELAEHVAQLAHAYGIPVHIKADIQPHEAKPSHRLVAATGERVGPPSITITPIKDESAYAIAMHELGHCCAPNGISHPSMSQELRLVCEEAAWEWAEHYALDWSPTMQHTKELCLVNYRNNQAALGGLRTMAESIARTMRHAVSRNGGVVSQRESPVESNPVKDEERVRRMRDFARKLKL